MIQLWLSYDFGNYAVFNIDWVNHRDERIRSSHDTICINTKEDKMIIYDTKVIVKYNIHNIHFLLLMITLKINITEQH